MVILPRNTRIIVKVTLAAAVLFITYQLMMCIWLMRMKDATSQVLVPLVLGTHERQKSYYTLKDGTFRCIHSWEVLQYEQINDDYCDCLDGSDEPGTNACTNGQFFCTQQSPFHNFPKVIASSKVNDGICDCCDGSDEWKHKAELIHLPGKKCFIFRLY